VWESIFRNFEGFVKVEVGTARFFYVVRKVELQWKEGL
jgi:hypothetical protein